MFVIKLYLKKINICNAMEYFFWDQCMDLIKVIDLNLIQFNV